MPFFSVVIPLYNKQDFIKATVESVLNQTFTDFELLIVEDCSTDNSLAVAVAIEDDRIVLLKHTKNKGLSASRNTGIKHAQSDYIAFLDADDLWKPDFLEKIYNLIIQFPEAGLFATDFEIKYSEKIILPTIKNVDIPVNSIGMIADYFKSNLFYPIYCPSSICASKVVFETVGLYDETLTFGEDIDFNIRANMNYKLAYHNSPAIQYLMFSQNQITTSNFDTKKIPDFDQYEPFTIENPSLKKYLDFKRYSMSVNYLAIGSTDKAKKLIASIDLKNLNFKQRTYIRLPYFAIKIIKKAKALLMKNGIQMTTFK